MPAAFTIDPPLTDAELAHFRKVYEQGWADLQAFADEVTSGNLVEAYDILDELGAHDFLVDWKRGRRLGENGSEDFAEPLTDADRRRNASYNSYMDEAGDSYRELTDGLKEFRAGVWQTGGMCLAVGGMLDGEAEGKGWYFMLTGGTGALPVDGDIDGGWMLGIYPPEPEERDEVLEKFSNEGYIINIHPWWEEPPGWWKPMSQAECAAACLPILRRLQKSE